MFRYQRLASKQSTVATQVVRCAFHHCSAKITHLTTSSRLFKSLALARYFCASLWMFSAVNYVHSSMCTCVGSLVQTIVALAIPALDTPFATFLRSDRVSLHFLCWHVRWCLRTCVYRVPSARRLLELPLPFVFYLKLPILRAISHVAKFIRC